MEETGVRNEISDREEGNLLMHYSVYTQTGSSALSEVLRYTNAHTQACTHTPLPRRQNERIVWALKPQTKH